MPQAKVYVLTILRDGEYSHTMVFAHEQARDRFVEQTMRERTGMRAAPWPNVQSRYVQRVLQGDEQVEFLTDETCVIPYK